MEKWGLAKNQLLFHFLCVSSAWPRCEVAQTKGGRTIFYVVVSQNRITHEIDRSGCVSVICVKFLLHPYYYINCVLTMAMWFPVFLMDVFSFVSGGRILAQVTRFFRRGLKVFHRNGCLEFGIFWKTCNVIKYKDKLEYNLI